MTGAGDLNPVERPDPDPILERLQQERRPGEIESGMMTGSDDYEISATDRFEGDLSREEALDVLDPEHQQPGH